MPFNKLAKASIAVTDLGVYYHYDLENGRSVGSNGGRVVNGSAGVTVSVANPTSLTPNRSRGNANGGIFGVPPAGIPPAGIAYTGCGMVAGSGPRPISDYTNSNGILGAPHIGLVEEDGAEAIIPLTAKRRRRGLALCEKAGELLGVKPRISGALSGGDSIDMQGLTPIGAYSNSNVTPIYAPFSTNDAANDMAIGSSQASGDTSGVNVENINIDIKVDGSNSPQDTVEEIAHTLAIKLGQVFVNLPKAARG